MRTADIVTAVILLGLGILLDVSCLQLGIGWGMEGPEAGFWPFIMSLGMTIGGIIVLKGAIQRKGVSKKTDPFIPRECIKPVLQCAIPAALMVFFTDYIGLYLAAAIYLAVYMRWIGKHRWATVLILSITIPLGSYYLFDKVFLIPMPQGSLMGWLPF
jgi:Tripartite tricarboxylate transporter TctB family